MEGNENTENQTVESQSSTETRSKPQKFVPTARLTVEKQLEILRGFAAVYQQTGEQSVSNADVAKVISVKPSTVAMTNHFFKKLELVTGKEGEFVPSEETIAFNTAAQWDADTAAEKLVSKFENAWFTKCILTHLQIRPTILESEAVRILAEESSASRHYEDQLEACVVFLEKVGLIAISGGEITTATPKDHQNEPPADEERSSDEKMEVATTKASLPSGEMAPLATLLLEPTGKRRIELKAPITITQAELERIQQWLQFQLIVEEPKPAKAKPIFEPNTSEKKETPESEHGRKVHQGFET